MSSIPVTASSSSSNQEISENLNNLSKASPAAQSHNNNDEQPEEHHYQVVVLHIPDNFDDNNDNSTNNTNVIDHIQNALPQAQAQAPPPAPPARILPCIVFSQFAGTSLWFAPNAVISDLQKEDGIPAESTSFLTSSVQLGFIVGTLVFAVFGVADRFSPSVVFCACACIGAAFNLATLVASAGSGLVSIMAMRFVVGVALSGVYPVGMKLAASWFKKLGNALGFLVGALVLGTAFPHLLKATSIPNWQLVVATVSVIAVAGGLVVLFFVPDGPLLSRRKASIASPPSTEMAELANASQAEQKDASVIDDLGSAEVNLKSNDVWKSNGSLSPPRKGGIDVGALARCFHLPQFRAGAVGYFGHQWELYTFWTLLPGWLDAYKDEHNADFSTSVASFFIIAAGSVACAVGGVVSRNVGLGNVAFAHLISSGLCVALSPLFFLYAPTGLFVAYLVFWGYMVVGDSPQFSAISVGAAPKALVGSALTLVVSIGFAITVVSIEAVSALASEYDPEWRFLPLFIGPVLGCWALLPVVGRNVKI